LFREKICRVKSVLVRQKQYFKEAQSVYNEYNLHIMRKVCRIMVAGCIIVELLTLYEWHRLELSLIHIGPFLLFGMLLPVLKYLSRKGINAKQSLHVTIGFLILFILSFMEISIFPMPDRPSAYFPVILAASPVLFYLPAAISGLVNTISVILFAVLAVRFKNPAVLSHELFEVFIAYITSWSVIIVMASLRLQTGETNERYRTLSELDGLTGLLNRRAGVEHASCYIQDQMKPDETAALLMIDVDDFKNINDTYGHQEGDSCLKECAKVLLEFSRKTDLVVRYGGDEFFILYKGIGLQNVEDKIAGMQKRLKECSRQRKKELSLSIGVYFFGRENEGFDAVLAKADDALYRTKNQGKNNYHIEQE